MKLDDADRSLSALRSMLGMKDSSGVGARLEKWTSEGSLGWVFDNPADSMTLDARFIGFDMTDFLDNADIRTPVMLYLFHRIDRLLTGERMVICIDEFWKALGDEAFRALAQDGLKTYRKHNANFFTLREDNLFDTVHVYMSGDNATSGAAGTSSGLSMLMGAVNIVIKDLLTSFDEGVTIPFIQALYHWNMQFHADPKIKGDFDIVATGSASPRPAVCTCIAGTPRVTR